MDVEEGKVHRHGDSQEVEASEEGVQKEVQLGGGREGGRERGREKGMLKTT